MVEDARTDFVVGLGGFALSWLAGDAAQNRLTAPDSHWMGKLGVQATTGLATDQAIRHGLAAGGYAPKDRMAVVIGNALDAMGRLILEGNADDDARILHHNLNQLSWFHPDEAARAAASEAALIVERFEHFGLEVQLRVLWQRHCDRLGHELARSLFGPDYGEQYFRSSLGEDYPTETLLSLPVTVANSYQHLQEEITWESQDGHFGFQ